MEHKQIIDFYTGELLAITLFEEGVAEYTEQHEGEAFYYRSVK